MRYERLRIVKEVEHYASVEVSSVHMHRLGPLARTWDIYTDTYYPGALATESGDGKDLIIMLDTIEDVRRPEVRYGPFGSWRSKKEHNRLDVEFASTVVRLKPPLLFRLAKRYWMYEANASGKDCVTVTAYFRTGDLAHRFSSKIHEEFLRPLYAISEYFSTKRTKRLTSRF